MTDEPLDVKRVFSDGRQNVLVRGRTNTEMQDSPFTALTDSALIVAEIQTQLQNDRDTYVILLQDHTWGPVLVTRETFENISKSYSIFPPFLQVLKGFVQKVSERDENFHAYDCRYLPGIAEVCYNVRYLARTGRAEPAWSMRHMALYQQFNYVTGRSRWLFVQPPKMLKKKLEEMILLEAMFSVEGISFILPHLALLRSAETAWREYLNGIEEECQLIDQKASFHRPRISDQDSFYLRFLDAQRLHRRRQRLQKAFLILKSCIRIGHACKKFCTSLVKHRSTFGTGRAEDLRSLLAVEFDLHLAHLDSHRQTVQLLLEQACHTASLLFECLQFRNDEVIAKCSQTMQMNSSTLADLGRAAKEDNAALKLLTEQASRDTQSTKRLTLVALFYLPASLVATIFSSDLITAVESDEAPTQTRFSAATQFWIFPVATIVLSFLTVIAVRHRDLKSLWTRLFGTRSPHYASSSIGTGLGT